MAKKSKGITKPKKVMKHKVKGKVRKNVRKKFYDIEAPLISTKIGLYAGGEEELEGRVVRIDLTRSLRGKSLELRMKVDFDGKKLKGIPVGVKLITSYIRRMMRKGTDYVEDSFEVECKDKKVIVKPFMITRKKVSRAVRNALREAAKKNLTSYVKSRSVDDVFSEIMTNKIQKQLSMKLKKIYPLALCEIRVFEVVGDLDKKKTVKEDKKEEITNEEESREVSE